MENYLKIIKELENELAKTKKVSNKKSEQMEFAIGHCQMALASMRQLVTKEGFKDKKSEINFFKKLKPCVYSKLLYYKAVFDIEGKKDKKDNGWLNEYLNKELEKIYHFYETNHVKVQYYRCDFTHLDEKYFTRDHPGIPLQLKSVQNLLDEEFTTWHDHTFSEIKAYDMLVEYLKKELSKLETFNDNQSIIDVSLLNWTGKKIYLIELIYALLASGMINNGNIKIHEIAKQCEVLLNIDLKDFYRSWQEIKQRKIDTTKFLDILKSSLIRRIDESDS